MKNYYLIFIILNPLMALSYPKEYTPEEFERVHLQRDHASLDERHVQASESFYTQKLQTNGKFDPHKIALFIEYLKEEREWIKNDIYETIILEKLELDLKKYKKVKKAAEKKINPKKSPFLLSYDEYLIPIMEELQTLVKRQEQPEQWQALVDRFARGYYPFHIPNAHRSFWLFDTDIAQFVKRMLLSRKVDITDQQRVEANNLIIQEENLDLVQICLNNDSSIKVGHYLTQYQIEKLARCDVDLSLFNPGISPLWEQKARDSVKKEEKLQDQYFPQEEDRVYFDEVSLRGAGTPKLKAWFERDEKKFKFKVKMGPEVHSDNAASHILQAIGFNQDVVSYRKEIKIYFQEKDNYEEFISAFANKYSPRSIAAYITAYGQDEDGARWILIEDVNLEARPDYEIRVSPIDIASWDLNNRREVRGSFLAIAWLETYDVRPGNYKLIYQKTDCCGLIPKIRFQDVGQSFGGPINARKPKYLLSFTEIYKVNQFEENMMNLNHNGSKVKLYWNDFFTRKRNFETATFFDFKWMARKIASLRKKDIYRYLVKSGMPHDVADLYTIKLVKRRNEMVKYFDLKEDFDEIETPDLDSYNPNKNVKNGKLIKKTYEGQNVTPHVQETWLTYIQGLLDLKLPVGQWRAVDQVGLGGNTGLIGLNGLSADLSTGSVPITQVTSIPIGLGVQAILMRTVSKNSAIMNEGGNMRLFKITDKVILRFGLNSGLLERIASSLPVLQMRYSFNVYIKEFEHIHYLDDGNKAYVTPFKLHKFIGSLEYFAAFKLKPLEVIRSYENFGIIAEGGFGAYSLDPIFLNEISGAMGVHRKLSSYFTRDQYNQLHFYDDRLKQAYGGFNLDLARLNLFAAELPLLSLRLGASHNKSNTTDYVFENQVHDRRQNKSVVKPSQRLKEYIYLKKLRKGKLDEIDYAPLKENYKIESKGKNSSFRLGALFLFNHDKVKQQDAINVSSLAFGEHSFYRYRVMRSDSLGITSPIGAIANLDVLTRRRNRENITVEMNVKNPEKFVAIVRAEDFQMTKDFADTKKLINGLNFRFSQGKKSKKTPFYDKYYLPPQTDVDKYKKVYALTRVFVNGKKFAKKILQFDDTEFKLMALRHFAGDDRYLVNGSLKHLNILQQGYIHYRATWLLHTVKKIKKILSKKEQSEEGEKSEKSKDGDETASGEGINFRKLARNVERLLHRMWIPEHGIYFLKSFLGKKGLFVMGEISGLLRSFSTLQDLQQIQRVRFMGKSWGKYKVVPPIQKFLRKNRLVQPSVHIQKNLSDNDIFGPLENAVAPNMEDIYNRNGAF